MSARHLIHSSGLCRYTNKDCALILKSRARVTRSPHNLNYIRASNRISSNEKTNSKWALASRQLISRRELCVEKYRPPKYSKDLITSDKMPANTQTWRWVSVHVQQERSLMTSMDAEGSMRRGEETSSRISSVGSRFTSVCLCLYIHEYVQNKMECYGQRRFIQLIVISSRSIFTLVECSPSACLLPPLSYMYLQIYTGSLQSRFVCLFSSCCSITDWDESSTLLHYTVMLTYWLPQNKRGCDLQSTPKPVDSKINSYVCIW